MTDQNKVILQLNDEIIDKKFLLLLALLTAFPAISTDMYLPAIPLLQDKWHQPLSVVNLTLVGFFVTYCIFLLIYGPVSDRFGRRLPLLAGIGIYVAASLMCAISKNITSLILFRILQACGAASASALSLAMTKDVYRGNERAKILAYIGVIMALAPMLAPTMGGWVMAWMSWRWIFIGQGIVGIIAWAGVFFSKETSKACSGFRILEVIMIYIGLFRNRRYLSYSLLVSLAVLPHFAFIGGAADIYITHFGLSEQAFGYFFAGNAAAIMAGSFLCSRLLHHMDATQLLALSFGGILAGGMGMDIHCLSGPWELCLPMALVSFSFGVSRPLSNNLVLEQVDDNAGAASSLLIFVYFMMGAFAMWLISFGWSDKIRVIGVLGILCGGSLTLLLNFLPSRP